MTPDGNLTAIAAGVSPASYGYDIRNRLTSAGTLTYTYDAENRRVAQTDASGTTTYVINPNATLDQVLMKTVGGVTTYYVYGLGLLHEETGGVVRYYHFDRRGDTVALTNSGGTVTGSATYGVFGELNSQTGTLDTPFLFNGRWGVQTDANGLYYHRARYYHPSLRRFLNQDVMLGSITNGASMNRYAYANGNPVSLIDPFGLTAQDADPSLAAEALAAALDSGSRYAGAVLETFKFWNWPQNTADFIGTNLAAATYDTENYFGWENNVSGLQQQFGTAEGWGSMLGAAMVASVAPQARLPATTSDGFLVAGVEMKAPFDIPVQRFGRMSLNRPDFWGIRIGSGEFANRTLAAIRPEWNSLTNYTQGVITRGTPIKAGFVGFQSWKHPGGSFQFKIMSNQVKSQNSSYILRRN